MIGTVISDLIFHLFSMNQPKREITAYFENLSLLVIGALLVVFPVLFLSTTTDAFVLPKQILLIFGTSVAILFYGLKTIAEGKVKLRTTPFNLPVLLFLIAAFVSSVLSVNRFDALVAFVPLLFAVLLFFVIVNVIKNEKQLLFILATLVAGAVLSALLTILSFFKAYPLPFEYSHVTSFTTFGSLLDQALYFAFILPIAGYFLYSLVSGTRRKTPFAGAHHEGAQKTNRVAIGFSSSFIVIGLALVLTLVMLFTSQKPLILPFETGLQTGFAALSQDAGRFFQGLLFGSGFGTYMTDFTRFKQAGYNASDTLWSFTFFRSSSFLLELLATTGLAGVVAFLFILFKIGKEGNYFFPLILAVVAAIFLPFSFTLLALFFVLLAVFAVIRIHANPHKYADTEFYFVALKRGLFSAVPQGEGAPHQTDGQRKFSRILPVLFFLCLVVIIGVPVYWTTRFLISDLTFQKSLVAASQNKGLETYNGEIAAINIFPYRDIYYRAFAQTNLALASSLAGTAQQQNQQPTAEVQQNIVTLIQQSINAGRTAVQIAPLTAFNWNNLSAIYRSLIGFGQNADQFTVLSAQQAIALDPNNPQQYVELGGVFYQVGQYDEAIRQFQVAINLKQNYANAYYNLGHALEEKKDLQGALGQYQIVKRLVADNPENTKKIDEEIASVTKKIGEAQNNEAAANVQPSAEAAQTPLTQADEKPSTTLPERDPRVKIPGPSDEPTSANDTTNTTAPSAAPQR